MSDGCVSVRNFDGVWTGPRLRNELPEYVRDREWLETTQVVVSRYLCFPGELYFTNGLRLGPALVMPPAIICNAELRPVADMILRELRRIWLGVVSPEPK